MVSTILIVLLCAALAQRSLFALAAMLPAANRRRRRDDDLPTVQVIVAARNEAATLPRLFERLEQLEYPRHKLSFVLVSDGSTDATPDVMKRWCSRRSERCDVLVADHAGKSAALQAGLEAAPGAVLTALYDADVQPDARTLRLLAAEFADPRVSAAAGAVMPSNAHVNAISRYAALELYVFHQVIQTARHRLRLNPPTIGANCVYRTAALSAIGGFPQHELSEDVATSFRLIDSGWRTSFRRDAAVTTEVPTTLAQFWRQRQRWTRGLSHAGRRAHGLSALLVASGYADRFVFLACVVGALFGTLAWFWPALYFAGPGLNIWVALRQARVRKPLTLLLGCLPIFVLDVSATIVGTYWSLRRSKPAWQPDRARVQPSD